MSSVLKQYKWLNPFATSLPRALLAALFVVGQRFAVVRPGIVDIPQHSVAQPLRCRRFVQFPPTSCTFAELIKNRINTSNTIYIYSITL